MKVMKLISLLDDQDSRSPSPRSLLATYKRAFKGLIHSNAIPSNSCQKRIKKGSEGVKSVGKTLGFGVSFAVFAEDLKVSKKRIFDPQDQFLLTWSKFFVVSCILAVSVDPLFFYLPVFDQSNTCFGIDQKLVIIVTTLRTCVDLFYLIHIALQFRTAYIAPSSRVFGQGELVINPAQIAKRYLQWYFIIDFLWVLPLPQIIIWRFLHRSRGSDVLSTKQALFFMVLLQYIPRFARIMPLTSELKRTNGVIAETAWAGAAYYLLLYVLASHIVGAFWYLLSVERVGTCWQRACVKSGHNASFLYCGNNHMAGYDIWSNISSSILTKNCTPDGDNPPFDFGMFKQALSSGVVSSKKFVLKHYYCLWWGLQNLSTLGQGLQTSTYAGESLFSITHAISGLILFALLIGNMQTYLQSLTIRLEEMRVKRHDSEQWMHHQLLPPDLRERVRQYEQCKWLETRGADEENLIQSLPKDLKRDIRRHLCLSLVKRVPLFENMDERLLDAICERLKPCLYTDDSYIVREGDLVDDMLFIIRGRLESVTTDGGRTGFFNRGLLKGDFCGEELLTWALDPKSGSNLPSSTRTVKALRDVEAFALAAHDLKFVAGQFRRLHSRQVQHTFRFYSQQWRTWAACFIQAAWRRHCNRMILEQRHKEEEQMKLSDQGGEYGGLGATFLVSRFATNAIRGVHRNRNFNTDGELVNLQKPPEPDFAGDVY
ncbi:hypothetical protein R6Q57_018940 [Mikania cordata]